MNSLKWLIVIAALATAVPLHAQSPNNNAKGNSGSNSTTGSGSTTAGSSSSGSTTNGSTSTNPPSTPAGNSAASHYAPATFEMPRLKARGRPDDPHAMPKEHATVHELAANGKANAHAHAKNNVDYIAIDPQTSWSSPVRGAAKDTTFVAFFVYASAGTSIEIGGANLLVHAAKQSGYLQLQIGRPTAKGMQWRDFGGPIKLESYDGSSLAALPVLTARLDGGAGIWDLYVGGRLGVSDLPLAAQPTGAPKQFTVHAGSEGAFVCGLISSDDNPLYEDQNRNGIDDAFEKAQNNGYLLTAPGQARTNLAQQWQQDQQSRQAQLPSWALQRPLPDAKK